MSRRRGNASGCLPCCIRTSPITRASVPRRPSMRRSRLVGRCGGGRQRSSRTKLPCLAWGTHIVSTLFRLLVSPLLRSWPCDRAPAHRACERRCGSVRSPRDLCFHGLRDALHQRDGRGLILMHSKKQRASWVPALIKPPDPFAPLQEWLDYRDGLDVLEARLRLIIPIWTGWMGCGRLKPMP